MSARVMIGLATAIALGGVAAAQETPVAHARDDATAALTAPPAPPSTAPAAATAIAPAPRGAAADPTAADIDAWLKADAQPVQALGDPDVAPLDLGPRRIHGEAGAFVSNHGYGGYAAAAMPIGQASELDVAVAGAHLHSRYGNANPKSIAVGLFLDGSDVGRWLSRDKCNVPRWGVRLPGDPEVLSDGSCIRTAPSHGRPATAAGPGPAPTSSSSDGF